VRCETGSNSILEYEVIYYESYLALKTAQFFTAKVRSSGRSNRRDCFQHRYDGLSGGLTDPSYCGQIVAMTYPLIGNYGVNSEDIESEKPQVKGLL